MAAVPTQAELGFTWSDLRRLLGITLLLVASITAVLGVDILPTPVTAQVGSLVPTDIRAPRAQVVTSQVKTEEAREAARASVLPQYDYTTEKALAIAAEQASRLRQLLIPIETAFGPSATPEQRAAILTDVVPTLSEGARATL